MQPWLLTLIIVLVILFLFLVVFFLTKNVRGISKSFCDENWEQSTKENFNKYWLDPVWENQLFDNVCCQSFNHIKKEQISFFRNYYSQEEIDERKYETRPFVCLKKFKHKGERYGMFVPLKTNHNQTKFTKNFYIDNDQSYIDISETIFAPLNVFECKNWKPNGYEEEDINMWHKKISWYLKCNLLKSKNSVAFYSFFDYLGY